MAKVRCDCVTQDMSSAVLNFIRIGHMLIVNHMLIVSHILIIMSLLFVQASIITQTPYQAS